MSKKTIKPQDLAKAVNDELIKYNKLTQAQVKKAVQKVGTDCRNEIKVKSPKKNGDYASGWRKRTVYESATAIRVEVYNATDYQLTHLLEYGHVVKNRPNGRVLGSARAFPHIRPAEERAQKELVKLIEKAVRG